MGSDVARFDNERAWRWRDDALGDVEFLRARYVTHSFAPHTHDGYAFGVIGGGAEAFWYRGATRVALPGELVALNPDELHTGGAAPGMPGWEYRMIYPSADLVERAAAIVGRSRGTPTFPDSVIADHEMACAFVRFHDSVAQGDGSLAEATSLLNVLALLVRRHASEGVNDRQLAPENRLVRTIREYIDANYRHNVTLGELSRVAGVSPFHLAHVFRGARGIPPHRYLEQRRVRQAQILIRQGLPLSAVAADSGFSDQSQLTRHFKRHLGVTPGAYQRATQSRGRISNHVLKELNHRS